MRKKGVIFIAIILIIIAVVVVIYSSKQNNINSFDVEGSYWSADIRTDKIIENGKEYFIIDYSYNGDIEVLKKQKRIYFHMGTSYNTEGIMYYDESIINDDISNMASAMKIDFSKIGSSVFSVKYTYPPGSESDLRNRITKSGINLKISMTTDGSDNIVEELKLP